MSKTNKTELIEEVTRMHSMNDSMRKEKDNLACQKEICRMVTDGTMDGTDFYMQIYYFVRTLYQKGGLA